MARKRASGSSGLRLLPVLIRPRRYSFKSAPSLGMSLVGGELEEASALAFILLQAAKTLPIEDPEIDLSLGMSPVGGELIEAGGFAVVLLQAAKTLAVEAPEIELSD